MADKPLYRTVLREAWQLTWRNKYLWIFGFFAALAGNGGEAEVLFRNYTNISTPSDTLFTLQDLYKTGFINTVLANIKDVFQAYPFQGILLFFVFLVIVITVVWLTVVSLTAIIDSAYKLKRGQKTTLDIAYKAGMHYFGPVLGVNIVGRVLIWAIYLVIALPLFTVFLVQDNVTGALLYTLVAFLVLVPITVMISFIVKYAAAYIVVKGSTFWEALANGWKLFLQNWLVSIEMAILVLAIGLIAGLGLILAAGIIAIPFVLLAFISLYLAAQAGFIAVIVAGLLLLTILLGVFGAAFATFQYSAWTLLFLKLVEQKAPSKIVRVLTQAAGYFSKK